MRSEGPERHEEITNRGADQEDGHAVVRMASSHLQAIPSCLLNIDVADNEVRAKRQVGNNLTKIRASSTLRGHKIWSQMGPDS